jgi:hypothetical protein
MISSLRNLNKGFLQEFYGELLDTAYIEIEVEEVLIQVPLLFFKKSTYNYSEAPLENYPIVSIEAFSPSLRDSYNNFVQKRYGALRDEDNDGEDDTISELPLPLWMEVRYEASVAAKDEKHYSALFDWFLSRFEYSNQACFSFNKVEIPDVPPIADYVPYKLTINESPRTDGIYEVVFSFTLYPRLDIKLTKDFDIVTEIEVISNTLLMDNEEFLANTEPLGINIWNNGQKI